MTVPILSFSSNGTAPLSGTALTRATAVPPTAASGAAQTVVTPVPPSSPAPTASALVPGAPVESGVPLGSGAPVTTLADGSVVTAQNGSSSPAASGTPLSTRAPEPGVTCRVVR